MISRVSYICLLIQTNKYFNLEDAQRKQDHRQNLLEWSGKMERVLTWKKLTRIPLPKRTMQRLSPEISILIWQSQLFNHRTTNRVLRWSLKSRTEVSITVPFLYKHRDNRAHRQQSAQLQKKERSIRIQAVQSDPIDEILIREFITTIRKLGTIIL